MSTLSAKLGFSLVLASVVAVSPALARRTPRPAPTPPPPVVVSNPNSGEWALIGITSTVLTAAGNGAGVKVAVLDGLTDCSNPALTGHCTATKLSGARYSGFDQHGTHTAGIVAAKNYGVASQAQILNYGVFASSGWVANGAALANIWIEAASKGASIASMSFGCTRMALCFTASEVQTIGSAQTSGMLFVKAAGNDGAILNNESIGVSQSQAQAALNRLILVGSVNATGGISSFSNRPGENCLVYAGAAGCTESLKWKNHFLVAPGELIYSTLPGSTYGYMSGTSMATPVVAGVAALIEARWPLLKAAPEAVATLLFNTATDLGAPGVDGVYGYGMVNAAAAFQAYGTTSIVSPTGTSTIVSNASISGGGAAFSRLSSALAGVTVYDSLGRDFALNEISSFSVRRNLLSMRSSLGQQLLGLGNQRDWSNAFFASRPAMRGWASFGATARLADRSTLVDRSLRAGIDLPIEGGVAQIRLTGAADSQLELAHDQTLRPLGFFASSNLLNKSMIGSALLNLSGHERLMVYGTATTGSLTAMPGSPLALGIAQPNSTAAWALDGDAPERRQVGVGVGYWTQPNPDTILGINLSMMSQKHGYYDLESSLDSFDKPTSMINLGVAASRRYGDWELSLAGEATHLRSPTSGAAIGFTPATLASASVTARKTKLLFGEGDRHDSLALSLAMPPRAIAGSLDLNYLTRTPDGLGRQAVRYRTSLSKLTAVPMRVEGAYKLVAGNDVSFSLAGGTGLARGGDKQLVGSFGLHF